MADYPAGVYAPRTKVNRPGVVYTPSKTTVGYAEDVSKLDAEVVAIETELGANPKGAKASVKARLDDVDTTLATIPVKATGAEVNTGTNDAKFVTPKAVADSNISFPAKTETYTNKRVTPRVGSEASSATPTINTDNVDVYKITALATAITSMTTNLSGTPTDTQKLIIKIRDNGTARAITWGNKFVGSAQADLPTTTTVDSALYVGFLWDTDASVWICVAVAEEVV